MIKSIKKVGELHDGGNLYKVTLDKVSDCFCEHCMKFRSKTYFFTGETASQPGGVTWCKLCAGEFDLSPKCKQKFKPGDKVYYEGFLGTPVKCTVKYYKDDTTVVVDVPQYGGRSYSAYIDLDEFYLTLDVL